MTGSRSTYEICCHVLLCRYTSGPFRRQFLGIVGVFSSLLVVIVVVAVAAAGGGGEEV